jgi:hypothetical protein
MPRYANDIAICAVQHQTLDSSCVEVEWFDRLDHEGADQALA